MHELTLLVGLSGAVLCMAERLTGPARCWGPSAVVLVVMALMACGAGGTALTAGAVAVAGSCLWAARTGPAHRRAPAVVDLATTALLTALAARPAGSPGHPAAGAHMTGMPGAYDPRFFLFLVACWLLARACVPLTRLMKSAPPTPPRPWRRVVREELGGAVMVAGMAAMLA
ncbi:hypothetical protein [Streptomyces liangshanensis]|uniref:DUF5134 domain-containing protein n=1 Tax=Streptomyces liangshanensis TaxID=2717324 RepID=A0A6G9GTC8_9ACTN|nr:hypothetical protein [Streptomyces liangshanensis]QIQ01454.1 hypothetical protein HA039_03315 [Streptomyces liangshanensis]